MISQEQIEKLANRIKRYLIVNLGKRLIDANDEEFYQAFSLSIREEIMVNWAATLMTIEKMKKRTLHYLSLEYLPGKEIGGNITNIGARELVNSVLHKMNRNYPDLIVCEPDPGLGNGGLGRLASCFIESLAAQQFPAWGYGLRYQYGIFAQEIWDGIQVERPDNWLLNEYPWDFRRDSNAVYVHFRGTPVASRNTHGDEVFHLEDFEEVRALPFDNPIIGCPKNDIFSVLSLRLWSTKESPRNFELQRYNAGKLDQAGENTSLTDVLYPNDHNETGKRIRLKQEFLLVSASLQDILIRFFHTYDDPKLLADKVRIQINDTHPALIIAEMIRLLTLKHDTSFNDAFEIAKSCCSYTNHTILKEALEEWNENRLSYLLPRQYWIIQKLNNEFCQNLKQKYQNDDEKISRMSLIGNGQVRMANLAIIGSHKVNGVAKLHTEILKKDLFKDFNDYFPEKFINVTNGVTHRRWLLHSNPELSKLITDKIDDEWIVDFRKIENLSNFAADASTQNAFLEMKKFRKELLFDYLSKHNPIRDQTGKIIGHSHILDPTALVDVQIKRLHEYKRQLMNALYLVMQYFDLKKDSRSHIKRMSIFGAKAAPGYKAAKEIIQFICAIARKINNDPDINSKLKIAFVENYNISTAEIIIPAADLSEQISRAGKEASGTGNMKLSMNGALTIATEDGANIELRESIGDKWWPFRFGLTTDEVNKYIEQNSYHAADYYIQNEKIRQAVDSLIDGTFATNDNEKQAFKNIYDSLLESHYSNFADQYFVIRDLLDYYDTQLKVENLFTKSNIWAEFAIQNIAGTGRFSSDESIFNYARDIWEIDPCPPNPEIRQKVKEEYSSHGGQLLSDN
jgi:glycogen phosphorylase